MRYVLPRMLIAATWQNGLALEQVRDAILDRVEVQAPPGSKTRPIVSTDARYSMRPR